MIVATSGHVDHGKTLLVHALTGIETDRLEEEKARGLTIDLGFAYSNFADQRIGFIDVPGHIKFIANMLAGVSAIDCGLLVIAADDGPMPQTSEHLAILDLIGIQIGAVVLTKVDRVTTERINIVSTEIKQLTEGTFLADAPIFPVSGTQRTGLDAVTDFLVETARSLQRSYRPGHFRLAVDRTFSVKGAGQVITGSVIAGEVNVGDDLIIAPQGINVRVRAIHRQNQAAERGLPGDRCAINIAGPDLAKTRIHRGNFLTSNRHQQAGGRVDAEFSLLANEPHAVKSGMPVHLHAGANHVTGRLVILYAEHLRPGATGLIQLILAEPINLCFGDVFILRDQSASRTLGGGRILDPSAPGRGRSSQARQAQLAQLASHKDPQQALSQWLQTSPEGISRQQISRDFYLTDADIDLLLHNETLLEIHELIIHKASLETRQQQLLASIQHWQKANPQETGLPLQQVKRLAGGTQALTRICLDRLIKAQQLRLVGNSYQLPDHAAQLSGAVATLWAKVEPILAREPIKPPVNHDLAKRLNLPVGALEKLMNQLVGAGYLVRPVANRYFLPAAIAQLREQVIAVAEASGNSGFSVADFRDTCGLGRNLCIELLEYFDRAGVTQRLGDRRKLRAN